MTFQIVFDCGNQFGDVVETAAANPLVGNLSKPTSTRFNQELDVGMKWMWNLESRRIQDSTRGCLWVA